MSSFAPNHICIITPERSGLRCLRWLDGKASFGINSAGPNGRSPKGGVVDGLGRSGAGVFVREASMYRGAHQLHTLLTIP